MNNIFKINYCSVLVPHYQSNAAKQRRVALQGLLEQLPIVPYFGLFFKPWITGRTMMLQYVVVGVGVVKLIAIILTTTSCETMGSISISTNKCEVLLKHALMPYECIHTRCFKKCSKYILVSFFQE